MTDSGFTKWRCVFGMRVISLIIGVPTISNLAAECVPTTKPAFVGSSGIEKRSWRPPMLLCRRWKAGLSPPWLLGLGPQKGLQQPLGKSVLLAVSILTLRRCSILLVFFFFSGVKCLFVFLSLLVDLRVSIVLFAVRLNWDINTKYLNDFLATVFF